MEREMLFENLDFLPASEPSGEELEEQKEMALEVLRFLIKLNREDWVRLQVLFAYLESGKNYEGMAQLLTERHGTSWRFTRNSVTSVIRAMKLEHTPLKWFLK